MKKKVIQPNIIEGYDDEGSLITYYWQKEPIKVRYGMSFKISRWLWWNPIWRFNQWRLSRKPITYGDGVGNFSDIFYKGKKVVKK